MSINWNSKNLRELVQSLLSLETEAECRAYLRDLMTEQEIETFSARLEAASLLQEGKLSYRAIANKTGMSTTTINRINNWLTRGKGGYRTVLAKLHHQYPQTAVS